MRDEGRKVQLVRVEEVVIPHRRAVRLHALVFVYHAFGSALSACWRVE